jgi:hypothetical protein
VSTPRIASPNQGADRGYGRGRPGLAEAGGSGGIPRADSRQVFTGAGTGVGYATLDRRGENRTRPGGLRPLGLDPSLAVGSRSVDPARFDVRQVLGCPRRVAEFRAGVRRVRAPCAPRRGTRRAPCLYRRGLRRSLSMGSDHVASRAWMQDSGRS